MARRSAGILLYRVRGGAVEVFLVHPGGPLYARRDDGVWSIPKGEFTEGEDAEAAARREFAEETGATLDAGRLLPLGEVRYSSGKTVTAWAAEGDLDPARLTSNTFTLLWPRRGGVTREYPEVDRGAWFGPDRARVKLVRAQAEFVDRLLAALGVG